jgi:hypothetical protein
MSSQNITAYVNLLSDKSQLYLIPVTGRGGPQGFEMSRLPHFLDSRLTMAVRLSALRADPPLSPGRFQVLISVRRT